MLLLLLLLRTIILSHDMTWLHMRVVRLLSRHRHIVDWEWLAGHISWRRRVPKGIGASHGCYGRRHVFVHDGRLITATIIIAWGVGWHVRCAASY